MPAWSHRRSPLAAWDLQAEEWFSRANRKCRVGARCRWVLAEQRDPAAAGGERWMRCASASLQLALDEWMSGKCGTLAAGILLRGLWLAISCVLGLAPEAVESLDNNLGARRRGDARKASPQASPGHKAAGTAQAPAWTEKWPCLP